MKFRNILIFSVIAILPAYSATVANWKVFPGGKTDGVNTGLNTNSPTIGNGSANNADNAWVAGYFGDVTLDEGENIILTGSINMSATSGGAVDNFRFGLWNDNGGFADNDPGSTDDWDGYIYFTAQQLSVSSGRFVSNDGGINYGGHSSTGSFSNNSTAAYDFSFQITRGSGAAAGQVDVTASLTGGDGPYSSTISVAGVNAPSYITDDWTFNSAGFLLGGNLNLSQAEFSDVEVNGTAVIPEPSSTLLIAFTAGLLLHRRRR